MKKLNIQKMSNKELDEAFSKARGRTLRKGTVKDKVLTEMKRRGKGSLFGFKA